MTQLSMLPKLDPDELMWEAIERFDPIAIVGLTSGGKDSTVVTHRVKDHLWQGLAFIDTGTAVPGVEDFVLSYARWLGKPLRVLRSGDAYRDMVLGVNGKPPLGFPSAGQHNRCYQQLKERRLEELRRELKDGKRGGKVLFVTGVRRAESLRRSKRMPITQVGSMGFVNPIIDWNADDCRTYAQQHEIPESDVAALLHKSGECNCGAFAKDGEREMLKALWPEWFDSTLGRLEMETGEIWGARRDEVPSEAGIMCSDCQLVLDA